MAERKPQGQDWESWIDRQIREAMQRGEFDGLPGHGKPIADLDAPRDEMWWVKRKLQHEEVSYLPPALALRKEVEDARDRIAASGSEAAVRRIAAEINARIVEVNSTVTTGPPSTVAPLDIEQVVAQWRAARRGPAR